jgi:hypothetical protein
VLDECSLKFTSGLVSSEPNVSSSKQSVAKNNR